MEASILGNVRGIFLAPGAISPSSRSQEAVTCKEVRIVHDVIGNAAKAVDSCQNAVVTSYASCQDLRLKINDHK